MNEKEIGEIRRRLRPEKNTVSHICGCYVNEKREVISLFDQPVLRLSAEETEAYLTLFKRTLSGTVGKNLIDVEFATRQVAEGEEHRLLMALRDSDLRDADALKAFYNQVIQSLTVEGNYVILLAHDTYDVPYRAKDGERMDDASSEVYSYIVCSICPVKGVKPALSYDFSDSIFHNRDGGWVVSAPELGFLFPAFDGRSANLYNALYYCHDVRENHREFADAVFHSEIPMPAAAQQETFRTTLEETLGEECRYDVVQGVSDQMTRRIEEHKENKDSEPPTVTAQEMRTVLESCGVSPERAEAFEDRCSESFGADSAISPQNLVDTRQMEIRTPDVVIRVSPERSDLIETRVINGTKYILICAEEGVEVNGVNIRIDG